MDIRDNKPFEQSADKFKQLETLLKVSINVFEVTLLPGYDDKSKDSYGHFVCSQIYHAEKKEEGVSLCVLNDARAGETLSPADDTRVGEEPIPKHFMFIKDFKSFKHHLDRVNDAKNNHLARNKKCRFCDYFGSATNVHAHEVQAQELLCDLPISGSKCLHLWSCMPTLNQLLTTRTSTSQSCCHV